MCTGESTECYKDVCHKFKEWFGGAKNVIYERLVFNRRKQQEGERIDHFVSELKRLALTCDFDSLKDSLIRDRIVGGVLSDNLRVELLKKPDLTLQQAHDYCRTYEASESQKHQFSNSSLAAAEKTVLTLSSRDKGTNDRSDPNGRKRSCKFCGYKHSFSHPTRCPAFKKNCRNCDKLGYFARMCPEKNARRDKKLNSVQQEDLPDNSEHEKSNLVHTYFNSVEIASLSMDNKKDKAMVWLKVAGKYLKMKADTGAEATAIPFKPYKELTKKPLQKIHQPLKGWLAVKAINPKGCVRLPTQCKGKEINLTFLVVDGDFTPLLICDACLDLEILKFMNLKLISGEVCEKESFDGNLEGTPKACGLETVKSDPVLKDYQDCFSYKPGKLTSEVHLEVDPSVSPVIHHPRKIPVVVI